MVKRRKLRAFRSFGIVAPSLDVPRRFFAAVFLNVVINGGLCGIENLSVAVSERDFYGPPIRVLVEAFGLCADGRGRLMRSRQRGRMSRGRLIHQPELPLGFFFGKVFGGAVMKIRGWGMDSILAFSGAFSASLS